MSKKRKRFAVVGGLIVLLLVAGGIIGALSPTPKKGEYSVAVQKNFLAGCEEGKTPDPALCHCLLVKEEANYSLAEVEALEADVKRGAPTPPRFKKLSLECHAPKGKWDTEAQKTFVANCTGGKQDLASSCHCLFVKTEAAYSGVEVEALEKNHDARYKAITNTFVAKCVRRSPPIASH